MSAFPRRQFLARAGAAAAVVGVPSLRVPAVEAVPTVFHGHPDATRTLVRFVVRNSNAPAGRMRVYDDRTGALLGTAGVLPSGGDRLIGELWLPLERRLRIRTAFEYPGTRRPLRDRFTLEPTPRWTLHWLLLARPDAVVTRLAGADMRWRGAIAAALSARGVQLDPVRAADPLTDLDAARVAWPAREASRTTGVPLAPLGSAVRGFASLPDVLAASGLAGTAGMLAEPWTVLESAPSSLGALQRLVEERLVASDTPDHRAIIVVPVADEPPEVAGQLDAWRQQYAAPVITLGEAPQGMRLRAEGLPSAPLPEGSRGLALRAAARAPRHEAEARAAFRTLARRLGGTGDPFDDVARALAYPAPGLVVFNAAPWTRTDVITLPDGHVRLATSVPGYGYALLASEPGVPWSAPEPVGTTATIASGHWRVRIGPRGAIESLVHLRSGTDLAGPGGLLAVDGARADEVTLSRASGLGERLAFTVRAGGLSWTTTVTVYDGMDVVDVATSGGPWHGRWAFDPAVGGTRVRWAVPLGEGVAMGAFGPTAAGDWFAADGERGTLMVTVPDGAVLARDDDGLVRCTRADGPARFRLTFARPALPEDPWRAGALALPFRLMEAPGTGGADLPTFGSLVEVRDPGVRLFGLRPAAEGGGVIAWLQDLMRLPRPVTLSGGLLGIGAAYQCDLLERDLETLAVRDGAATLRLPETGLAAVRLLGG